ncbi:HMCN1 [Symbiodinium natans]|uniref:HMCN1 protein n=1 Tax=Symbiodinium natans TaxID=878477 RepID=A0A812RQV3_9DINO|nr:HMCN1 [Symbiodinium natans]
MSIAHVARTKFVVEGSQRDIVRCRFVSMFPNEFLFALAYCRMCRMLLRATEVRKWAGCDKGLGMTQQCEGEHYCGRLDCEWGQWSEWSGCTCSCDGGQQTRTRHIARAPRNGGSPCQEGDKEQIAPCNTQPCGGSQCRDGQLDAYSHSLTVQLL